MRLRTYSLIFLAPVLALYGETRKNLFDIFPRSIPKKFDNPPKPSRIDEFLGIEKRIPSEKVIIKKGWILPQGKDRSSIKNLKAVDVIIKAKKEEKKKGTVQS